MQDDAAVDRSQASKGRRAHDTLIRAMELSGRALSGDTLILVRTATVDAIASLRQALVLREEVECGSLHAARPVLEGGLMVAAADLAVASDMGMILEGFETARLREWLFGEEPGRFLVAAGDTEAASQAVQALGSTAETVGRVGGESLICADIVSIPLTRLRQKYTGIFRRLSGM